MNQAATEAYSSDVAFTPTVKAVQARKGSRESYGRIQQRGGPPGFLHVLDEQTVGFADFAGNRQYITQGNLADNPKAYLFLIDYAQRRRVKIWGEARVIEGDDALTEKLMPADYKARADQAITFTLKAWDTNCQQHIPQRFDAADVAAALAAREARIAALESELASLREFLGRPAS